MDKLTIELLHTSDGGWLVDVPELPGCATFGRTIRDALAMASDAIESYLLSTELDKETRT